MSILKVDGEYDLLKPHDQFNVQFTVKMGTMYDKTSRICKCLRVQQVSLYILLIKLDLPMSVL